MLLKKFTAVITAAAAFLSAPSVYAACPDRGNESSISTSKLPSGGPRLYAQPVSIPADKIGDAAEVSIIIDNPGSGICTTGIHIYWDDRLIPLKYDSGKYAQTGEAASKFQFISENISNYGCFAATIASQDQQANGTFLTLRFNLPPDAKEGDIFPIDIAYVETEMRHDLFTNNEDDTVGRLMQSWLFTRGIHSSVNPSADEKLINAGATFADGYI
ncbi:MAG TPA: hypothetical protein PKI82_07500, partial [Ruminococcus flavefaciens]|nr:hypothetical protein [Ruminococcus flavefaciens]